jgi:hypothetical protein
MPLNASLGRLATLSRCWTAANSCEYTSSVTRTGVSHLATDREDVRTVPDEV